ncbi:MAG: YbaN family protein [Rikenellaceae bacterium]
MKFILSILGVASLALGVIGIFVPLLPTTPFLLLSAALFLRSSPRLYSWLMRNPTLGEYIINYRENRSMPMRAKCTSVSLVWISILYSEIYIIDQWWLRVVLTLLAVAITWHILSLNTTPRKRR